jgi:hypothetical protein
MLLTAQSSSTNLIWNTSATSLSIGIGTSGTYWARATNAFNCQVTDTIDITIDTLPTINLGTDITACLGDTSTIGVTKAGLNYLWNTSVNTSTIHLTQSGNYWVAVTDGNGCKASDSLKATFNPSPLANLGADAAHCDSTLLQAGNLGSTFKWNTASTDSSLWVKSTGKYWLEVTNSFGCTSSDTVSLTIAGIEPG